MTYSPEVASAAYVANIFAAQSLRQHLPQDFSILQDAFHQATLFNDGLDLEPNLATLGEVLESVTVAKSALHDTCNIIPNEHGRNRSIAARKAFTDDLDVGDDISSFSLPCVNVTSSSHSAHDFIEDEKYAVSSTDFLHRCKIALHSWSTPECLSGLISHLCVME